MVRTLILLLLASASFGHPQARPPLVDASVKSGADVTTGLVAYYKLDEASGTEVHDSSGFGFNGAVTALPGTYSWDPGGGKVNGAFKNYSANQPITIPGNSLNDLTGAFSIALWVKTNNGVQTLVSKSFPPAAVGNMIQGYRLIIAGINLQMELDAQDVGSNLQISPNQWTHIAVVKSGTILTFYVNGVADIPITVPPVITATNSPLILGVGGGGYLDDVRFYDRALSTTEVQTILNSAGAYVGSSQTPPPTINSFTATSSSAPGKSATLSYAVSAATRVSISNGPGPQTNVVKGTVPVSPSISTTYTLTASNAAGSATSRATVVVAQPPPTYASDIVITSPLTDAVVSGNMSLAVNLTSIPGIASVEYFFDGRPLPDLATSDPVGPLSAPYTYTWNSRNEWNGFGQLTAQALDSSGNILSESAPINIQIANGPYTLQQTFPLAGQTASGIIEWTEVSGANTPSGYGQECFVDGLSANSGTYDTTQLPNGTHDFHCLLVPPGNRGLPVAMSSVPVSVDNGQTPMRLQSNFKTVYLTPGQTQILAPKIVNTDGSESPTSATYSIDNSAVATVNSNGTITAVGVGAATITVAGGDKWTAVQVIVNASHDLPHFSKSGQILNTYEPGNSLFVKSIFQGPGADDFQADPQLATELSDAGVNTLETGAYFNPADGGGYSTSSSYSAESSTIASADGYLSYENTAEMAYLNINHWSVLLTGDNIGRDVNEMLDSVFDPYSTPKIQFAMRYWEESGKAIGISMIDEVDGSWGCNPLDSTSGYWEKWSPKFISSPFITLLSIVETVPHPNLSWPTIADGSPICLGNWQGNPSFANFTNLYFDNGGWFYPDGESLYESHVNALSQKLSASLRYMQTGKPLLTEVGFTGPAFDKNVAGVGFLPGVDTLDRSGDTSESVGVDVFGAIAKGSAGVRLFSWGPARDLSGSISAGSAYNFFGGSPYYGLARWNAMSAALNLAKVLEPYILSPMANAIDLGPYVETGAHAGPYGNMLIAINSLNNPQTINPDLAAYVAGSSVTRYRLGTSQVASQNLGAVTSDQVTLQPGEVVVYLFPAGANIAPAAPVIHPANPGSLGKTPITVSVTSPVGNFTHASGSIAVAASVTDTAGTPTVQFMADGVPIGLPVTTAPYQIVWNIDSVAPGKHYITAFVKDAAGNQYVSNATHSVTTGTRRRRRRHYPSTPTASNTPTAN
jgi:Concanavalin A-like lectin/glucanases superfamily/Bacterial Ig domain/Bacterial Ig-like domain (group 2)